MPKEKKVKGIKNEEGLKYFAQALLSVLAKSDTKAVIRAASEGDLDKYKEAIKNLKLKRITDYNFVLVIFSPIVAVATAWNNKANDEEIGEDLKKLKETVERLLGCTEFKTLCDKIGKGDGPMIQSWLQRIYDYKLLLSLVSGSQHGKNGDQFMQRAGTITPWKVNGKYVRQKLIPFVEKVFDSKYANAVRQGLPTTHAPVPESSASVSDISEEYGPSYESAETAPRPRKIIKSATQITLAQVLLEIKDGHFDKVPLDVLQKNGFLCDYTLEELKPHLKKIQEIVKERYGKIKGFRSKTKKEHFIKDFEAILSGITVDIGIQGGIIGMFNPMLTGESKPELNLIMEGLSKCLKHT